MKIPIPKMLNVLSESFAKLFVENIARKKTNITANDGTNLADVPIETRIQWARPGFLAEFVFIHYLLSNGVPRETLLYPLKIGGKDLGWDVRIGDYNWVGVKHWYMDKCRFILTKRTFPKSVSHFVIVGFNESESEATLFGPISPSTITNWPVDENARWGDSYYQYGHTILQQELTRNGLLSSLRGVEIDA